MTHFKKTAVLLVNTGSPAEPTEQAVARYLIEFLGDPRVVELSPWIWQPLLRYVIVPRRAKDSAERYKTVWSDEGSPLMSITARTARALQAVVGDNVKVFWAMCYGTHRVSDVMQEIAKSKFDEIVILPLFAQYATQTTEAVNDAVKKAIRQSSIQIPVRFIESFHDHPLYIEALAKSVRAHWEKVGALPEGGRLLMSFHSIPQASSDRGDPYEHQCKDTARLLAQALSLKDDQWAVAFQSKFGRAKWLEPSAIEQATAIAKSGCTRCDVLCPGFAADCLETIEEIGTELRGIYDRAGGKNFYYIQSINDNPDAIKLYHSLVSA